MGAPLAGRSDERRVYTLVLDAEPLRVELLRLWVGAATRDGDELFSSVIRARRYAPALQWARE